MKQFAELVNAGIDGVKDVSEEIEIVIHSLSDKNPSGWLSNLIKAGVKKERIDIFGLSYYKQYHGTPNDLMNNLTGITRTHDVKIVVAEYAEVHEQVNDIVFNLPGEKGIGTFVWEPTRWNETLFTNGRTNYRIDIYPNLWTRYGNDTLPLKDKPVANRKSFSIAEQGSDGNVWIARGGVLRRGDRVVTGYSILDLQGRIVAADRGNGSASLLNLPAGNVYIVRMQDAQKRDIQRVLHCIW
jgi:arabinogalactan endo-1,4-beta-galactosidase